MVTEGIDYSRTAGFNSPSVASLHATGKLFVGRYAVNDKSPNGRGMHAAEYQRFVAGGIDSFLYWEATEAWMLGGWNAGVAAAVNAQQNINAASMPTTMPVYFAHDIDPEPRHFAAIDECLRGIASVVGTERVGIYGGWLLMEHCANAGNARWLCQTLAWQYGRGVHPSAHLHQYGFNAWIDGTNCDLVRAYREHYGQASDFTETPLPTPDPIPIPEVEPTPKAEPFDAKKFQHGLDTGTDQYDGKQRYSYTERVMAVRKGRSVPVYTRPGGKKVGTLKEGAKLRSAYIADLARNGKTENWLFDHNGYAMKRSGFTPKLVVPQHLK